MSNSPAQDDDGDAVNPVVDAPRCGFVAVIGAPNAGKSTLVNRLVGAKVAIVSQKVQTTRARIRGIAVEDNTQIVFIDTPGIFRPRRKLDRAMVSAAWEGLDGADATLLIVDVGAELAVMKNTAKGAAVKAVEDTRAIVATLKDRGARPALVLNKIDRMKRDDLLAVIAMFSDLMAFDETFLVSAEKGDGVRDLFQWLVRHMPSGPWMYPGDQLSDISDRLMAAEVTREKIYLRLHQEVPYETTVETESWKRDGKGLRIDQTVYVSREGMKPIVLGKGGQTLKAIGAAARADLEDIYGPPVHLFIHVKAREGWSNEDARLRALGLDVGR